MLHEPFATHSIACFALPTSVPDPAVALQSKAELHWDQTDPTMAALSRANPLAPTQFGHDDPFRHLVDGIVFQQVSLASGAAVFGRLQDATPVTPEGILALGETGLRGVGLSRMKCSYLLDLSGRVAGGELDLQALASMSDADVERALTAVRGIGPWTAKMFLMFHLQRMDVVSPEDLGLRQGFADAYGGTPEDAWEGMRKQAAAWSPYGTVACRVLWKARRNED